MIEAPILQPVLRGFEKTFIFIVEYRHDPSPSCNYGRFSLRKSFGTHSLDVEATSAEKAFNIAEELKCSDIHYDGCNSILKKSLPEYTKLIKNKSVKFKKIK